MSSQTWIDPRINSVPVAAVKPYLLNRGWQLQPYPGPELLVFGGPVDDDGQPILQVLPSSETLRDYRMRLEELLGALSVFEDRPAPAHPHGYAAADLFPSIAAGEHCGWGRSTDSLAVNQF